MRGSVASTRSSVGGYAVEHPLGHRNPEIHAERDRQLDRISFLG